jgi:drug/metabolite transporter (DMT)-like permease
LKPVSLAAPAVVGAGLMVVYTLLITGADAITKAFAESYAAPQLFAVSGGIVAGLSLVASRLSGDVRGVRTYAPRAMALRSAATVAGALAFFHAFRLLPFAEVFLFIALIPIFAGILSGPVLSEPVRPQAWGGLALASMGVLILFPSGLSSIGAGHLVALLAALLGTVSMLAARYICRIEGNLLAQVFYPNAALMVVMALALPFVFQPMPLQDLGWALSYGVILFGARWVLVGAMRVMPAYVVTPLMNLQFLWMVVFGILFFAEMPAASVFLGAGLMIGASAMLMRDQLRPRRVPSSPPEAVVPAE